MSKKEVFYEEPIDKVESYIEKNFKKILAVLAGIIVFSLLVYLGKNIYDSNKNAKIDAIGDFEMKFASGIMDNKTISDFITLCESNGSFRDYGYFKAGTIYLAQGDRNNAVKMLQKAEGDYREMAASLLYDIGEKIDTAKYSDDAQFASLWKYRKVVAGNKINSSDNISDSALLQTAKNWE